MSDENIQEQVQAHHHLPQKNLWQRWTAWNGSFLVISILVHVLLLGGATLLVVQVVQSRKEKLKFTAAPPSANASAEHKVKPSKKTAAAAPAISKRITSTGANASIALPPMDMNSTGPDVMASVMSGMGASGLGAGGSGGAAGMASMPLSGLTAFGFKGADHGGGLTGHIYDLKQTTDHQPTDIFNEGLGSPSQEKQLKLFSDFFSSGWDEKLFSKYYRAKDPVVAYQIMVPYMRSTEGPKAFGVEKEVPVASHWCIVYSGTVVAPKDGTYRFVGWADDQLAVRFNNENVMFATLQSLPDKKAQDSFVDPPGKANPQGKKEMRDPRLAYGKWFNVSAGATYPMQVLIAEMPGGVFTAQLYIEEKYPEKPYPKRTLPGAEQYPAYPIFQLKKGFPIPERKAELTMPPKLTPEQQSRWHPSETYHEIAPDPVIFNGK